MSILKSLAFDEICQRGSLRDSDILTLRGLYYEDGRITETTHFPGDTRHLKYGKGEHLVHSVENIGTTDLLFTTVEYKQSANAPLPVPDTVRLVAAA